MRWYKDRTLYKGIKMCSSHFLCWLFTIFCGACIYDACAQAPNVCKNRRSHQLYSRMDKKSWEVVYSVVAGPLQDGLVVGPLQDGLVVGPLQDRLVVGPLQDRLVVGPLHRTLVVGPLQDRLAPKHSFSITRRSCSLRDRNFESTSNFKTQRNKKCDQICEA